MKDNIQVPESKYTDQFPKFRKWSVTRLTQLNKEMEDIISSCMGDPPAASYTMIGVT